MKIVLVTDFDGTISKVDFFIMATHQLMSSDKMAPWYDYLEGKITHLEALNRIFANIHLPQKAMNKFISSIEIDPAFYDFLKFKKRHRIPLFVASAGCAYYIKKRISRELKNFAIHLIANRGTYSPQNGLKLIAPPKTSPFYSEKTGVSKVKIVEFLKKKKYFVVYAGDGRPDFKAAQKADIVFAKGALLKLCREAKMEAKRFNSFNDILAFFRGVKNGK